MEFDFNDEKWVWSLYAKYTYAFALKAGDFLMKVPTLYNKHALTAKTMASLMKPGLFCEYFAIWWHRALKSGKPKNTTTIDEIIVELAQPDCIYSSNPCGPVGCMQIYEDVDGENCISMYQWK